MREGDFELVDAQLPRLEPGQFLIRTLYLSVAPVMRMYMLEGGAGEAPLAIGAPMRGRGVGVIVASRNHGYAPGEFVQGKLGWREYAVADGDPYYMLYRITQRVAPLSTGIGILGVTGFTSYLGLVDVARLAAGDRVLVSGAAGGVGSSVGQIARHLGASRIVGIAGSDEKCQLLVEQLGYDAAINYRTEDLDSRLTELLPDGLDVLYDNVGGETLDTALMHLRIGARIALCGRISEYLGNEEQPYVLRNYQQLHKREALMEAFFIYRLETQFPRAEQAMARMIEAGALRTTEDVLDGIEWMPRALMRLYDGANRGKQIVRVDPQAESYRTTNPWTGD